MHLVCAAGLILASSPAIAASERDWFASLYTGEGIELRVDERVFTAFAVFNASGFDQGRVVRKDPVPKVVFHPVREQVRAHLIDADPQVRRLAGDFLDKNPAPLRDYLSWTLRGPPPPFSTPPTSKAKELVQLKGFEAILAKAWVGWKLGELMDSLRSEHRKTLKSYLHVIDAPLAKARQILKVPDDGPRSLLVVNLLDTHDIVRGVLDQGEVVLVVGPSDQPNLEELVREYARVLIEPLVANKASHWGGGAQLLREAQMAGATEETVNEYATGLLSYAVALKALATNEAGWEAAQNKGYFGIKDIAKMFDGGKPLNGWLLDALAKAETRRPASKK